PRAAARKIDKSIAVLPFESLSDEKENAYFADGVQDDILTNLSKIGDLKVISRTSVMSYRGHTPNVREIGKALGVSTILEGSVREDLGKLKQGEEAYERAITLDPNFALAFARYSQLESWIVHSFERASPRREKARSLAVRAVQLQPQLPEAHLALGFVYYYVDNNFQAAASEFEIAEKGLPNESEGYLALGAIQRRQGKWTESNASLEKAVSLNPNDTWSM